MFAGVGAVGRVGRPGLSGNRTAAILSSASLRLDFMSPGNMPAGVTFTRTTTGTYFDSTGTIQTAAINQPRWDYDPTTLQLRGLLMEEARTNLCINSQAFGSWTKVDIVTTDDAIVAPDGTLTADRITEGVATNAQISSTAATISPNAFITFSLFLKRGNTDFVRILGVDNGSANGINAWINLTNGAVSSTVRGTVTAITAVSVALPNGWYRVLLKVTMVAASTVASIVVNSATADQSVTRVNNAQYHLWGAMVEVGAFPTSYIATTGTTAGRALENASIPLNVSWFNPAAVSLLVEFFIPVPYPVGTARDACTIHDGTTTNRLFHRAVSSGGTTAQVSSVVAGIAGSITFGTTSVGVINKIAGAWDGVAPRGSFNGSAVQSYSQGLPTGLVTMTIGNTITASGQIINAHMRQILVWRNALLGSELQQVSR